MVRLVFICQEDFQSECGDVTGPSRDNYPKSFSTYPTPPNYRPSLNGSTNSNEIIVTKNTSAQGLSIIGDSVGRSNKSIRLENFIKTIYKNKQEKGPGTGVASSPTHESNTLLGQSEEDSLSNGEHNVGLERLKSNLYEIKLFPTPELDTRCMNLISEVKGMEKEGRKREVLKFLRYYCNCDNGSLEECMELARKRSVHVSDFMDVIIRNPSRNGNACANSGTYLFIVAEGVTVSLHIYLLFTFRGATHNFAI